MNKTLLICATALLVASCSKDTSEILETKPQGIIFSVAQDNITRTKLDGVNILWQRDDAVGIFSPQIAEAVNYKAVIAEEDHDKQFASLRTDLNYNGSGEHSFYAYYPYADGQIAATTVNGSISALQNGEIDCNAFMWATTSVDPTTMPRVDLHFKHPFTYLNIQLRTTGEYRGAAVERIRIEVPEGKTLAGNFEADLINGVVSFTTHERSIEVLPASEVLGEDYINTFMVVNPEDLTDSELTVRVTLRQDDGNAVKLRTVKTGRLLNPQMKVNMKLTVEEMEIDRSDDDVIDDGSTIKFADPETERICLEYWDTNHDGRLSYKEAAAVQSLGGAFQNSGIHSFDELQYFKGLTSIDSEAFSYCRSLADIVIPENIVDIGSFAFYFCSNLTDIIFPDNLTSIAGEAFEFSGLTSVTLPNKISQIGVAAFSGCANMKTFNGKYASEDRRCLIKDGYLIAFAPASLKEYAIPECVTSIGIAVFEECTALESVSIPQTVTFIGAGAFICCEGLKSITIPNGVTTIEHNTFEGCDGLKSITIPDSVTEICRGAFYDCRGLESVTLSKNLITIGDSAFEYCDCLTDVYCRAITPPTYENGAFYKVNNTANLYVPTESVELYCTAYGWEDFSRILGYDYGDL